MGADQAIDTLATILVDRFRRAGHQLMLEEVRDALWEAGVGDLMEDLAIARSVVCAADGFHPVASFFVHGSREQELILRVLANGDERTASPRQG